MTTDASTLDREGLRKLGFLTRVMRARSAEIAAGRLRTDAEREARAAGCTPDEIAGAVRIIDRAAVR